MIADVPGGFREGYNDALTRKPPAVTYETDGLRNDSPYELGYLTGYEFIQQRRADGYIHEYEDDLAAAVQESIPPDDPIDPTLAAACDLMGALGDDPDEISRAIMFISRVVTHECPDPHRFAVGMAAVARMAGEVAHGLHSRATCGDHSPCVKSAQVIDLTRARSRDN